MDYEISINGEVIATTDDWSALMQKYKVLRKKTKQPLHLEKVEEEDESYSKSWKAEG